ncbi:MULTISPECIES: hypothetical protein [Thalassospira]|uniref:Uncharacterized protein n=1 Tax=Thalassospira povalilytica TaxID=732237 RepID=A0A8I1SLJ5_9PROT|nr:MULTISPECIES: hypothetical protein [Thalassospira]MEE3043940.1 hypothetical protein [Pseudomonadota bacterium]RCK20035.1 hypothetical protein TH8_19350 [Thalassospira profundimaris]KZB62580.1 hypothetical protein AUQ42_02100 [Thalassospira sp. MCCC 1A02491]MBN8198835.1 hypothetical protein [Thalassospira povalilytica]MBO6772917.1 hypothetical protein [Thalassospira sp.]
MSQDTNRSKSRFMMGMEHVLREINHEIISPAIPDMSVENAVPLMITVARLRADYLKYAFKLSADRTDQHPTEEELKKLRHLRETYQEMLAAARELEHCIDRGYIDLPIPTK